MFLSTDVLQTIDTETLNMLLVVEETHELLGGQNNADDIRLILLMRQLGI